LAPYFIFERWQISKPRIYFDPHVRITQVFASLVPEGTLSLESPDVPAQKF
jgi:hypothetical protein